MKLSDAMKALESAKKKQEAAAAKTREAKAALKEAKKEAISVARTAIGKALVSGVEEGLVTVDLDWLAARAKEQLASADADAADQIIALLAAIRAAPEKAVDAAAVEPAEEGDALSRTRAGEPFSEEPTDATEENLATGSQSPPRPHVFRRPG